MSRTIEPPRNALGRLRTPLTAGESAVLEFFDQYLPEAWEIYVQPHLNGLRPDFVLLNPRVGIAVFEVKDWDLSALPYHWRMSGAGMPVLWAKDRQGNPFPVMDDPVAKADRYRRAVSELYCPSVGYQAASNHQKLAMVTSGVIMAKCRTDAAKRFFEREREKRGMLHPALARYYPLSGGDCLGEGCLYEVFPEALCYGSMMMTERHAEDLRRWLVEPDFAAAQRRPLELDDRQRALVKTRTDSGYRRIRGPAGSGKSTVLAGRAGELAAQGRDVLVVSYNITLGHWLRDMAVRYPLPGRRLVDRTVWTWFHRLCRDLCFDARLEEDYKGLRSKGDSAEAHETGLPRLAGRALELIRAHDESDSWWFDAVLVDEGQDFRPDWWALLRRLCRPGGEMMLVADRAQDVYERSVFWTEQVMNGAGFSGPWSELGPSYRLPTEITPYVRDFLARYAPDRENTVPVAAESSLPGFCNLRWVQVHRPDDLARTCVDELLRLPESAQLGKLAFAELHLLVPNHELGMQCVRLLNRQAVHCCHTFGRSDDERRPRKMAFFTGDPSVKGCTIHSFKGWEARAIVLAIEQANANQMALYYVALTRLQRNDLGSYLTVVCADSNLRSFGEAWPEYLDASP